MLSSLRRLNDRLYRSPSFLLGLCSLFWAGNAIASRLAVGHISPLTLVFLRWVLVLGILWPIYGTQVRAHWPQIRPQLASIVLMGMLGFTGFNVLFYVAGHYTTAINLGILQGALPIFVMAGAFFAHGARTTPMQALGVLITTLGVLVIATGGAPLSILEIEFNRGDLMMLIACVFYAFYTVALRKRPPMYGPVFFTLLASIAAITSLPLVVFEAFTTGLAMPTTQGFLVTAFIALFPSCLAQLLFLRGVDLIGPGRTGIFMNLVPVFSAIMAVALLGEPFALFHLTALVLVISGILLAEWARGDAT